MDDNKQGWDKIAEQEKKDNRKRKFGDGAWFSFNLIIAIIVLLLVIGGIIIWITGA